MRKLIAALLLVGQCYAVAAAEFVKKPSQHSVGATVDKLTQIVTDKGFTVIARVDHAAAAEAAGLELAPTQLLIFGNPKVGTQLMTSQRSIGVDLPIRVLVWEEADGSVWLTYTEPTALLARHGIDDREPIREKMTGALNAFTDAATQ